MEKYAKEHKNPTALKKHAAAVKSRGGKYTIKGNVLHYHFPPINTTNKTKLIVIEEHTLAYLPPNSNSAGILHTSVLRGSHYNKWNNIDVRGKKIRLASKKDFEDYNVHFGGFGDTKLYAYKKIKKK